MEWRSLGKRRLARQVEQWQQKWVKWKEMGCWEHSEVQSGGMVDGRPRLGGQGGGMGGWRVERRHMSGAKGSQG